MRQVEQSELQVVGGLDGRQAALGQRRLLERHISRGGLAVVTHGFEPCHLQGVNLDLPLCDIEDFLIIEDLDIGLCHGDADVIARLLQVLRGRLQIQTAEFDVVAGTETVEQRHVGTQAEARARGIRIGVGIVGSQAAAERKVLGGAGSHAGQPAVLCRIEVDFALLDLQGALLHGEVVLQCVGDAFLEGPRCTRGGRLSPRGGHDRQQQGEQYDLFHVTSPR